MIKQIWEAYQLQATTYLKRTVCEKTAAMRTPFKLVELDGRKKDINIIQFAYLTCMLTLQFIMKR